MAPNPAALPRVAIPGVQLRPAFDSLACAGQVKLKHFVLSLTKARDSSDDGEVRIWSGSVVGDDYHCKDILVPTPERDRSI